MNHKITTITTHRCPSAQRLPRLSWMQAGRKLILALGLMLSMGATAQKPWDHGRLMVSANQHYLQHADGTPFFWQGDTGWLLPQRLNRDEAAYYLSKCRKAGYNVVQIQVLNGVPSINIYGQPSLIDGWNFQGIDRPGVYGYWDHLDYIVRTAARQGIYIAMVPIWGTLVNEGRIDVEGARSYAAFLAERYKEEPNIVWMIGGDIQGDIRPEIWETLATTIKAHDTRHLMTYHPRGRYTSARWWSKASWLDFHTFQSGHRKYGQRMGNAFYPIPDGTEEDSWMYVDSTWAHKPVKPVLDAEPSYEDIPKGLHDPDEQRWQDHDVRRYAYWSVFAGSCGHTYGHNAIMQMLKPGYVTGYGRDGEEKTWYEAVEAPGFNQMKHLSNLMLSLPYMDRVPDQSIIAGKNGTRYERLMATRGNDYLMVYNYTGRAMPLDLTKITGKKKRLWWMNAQDGRLTYMGETDSKTGTFYRPTVQEGHATDGVLIAIDASKDYLAPGQKDITDHTMAARQRNLNE